MDFQFLFAAFFSVIKKEEQIVGRSSGWWFQPIWKILVESKWESSPNRGENKKYLEPPPSHLLSISTIIPEIKINLFNVDLVALKKTVAKVDKQNTEKLIKTTWMSQEASKWLVTGL